MAEAADEPRSKPAHNIVGELLNSFYAKSSAENDAKEIKVAMSRTMKVTRAI